MGNTNMFTDTKSIEDTTPLEHDASFEMKEGDDAGKCKFGEQTKMTRSYYDGKFLQLMHNCAQMVDSVPLMTTTNIDKPFAYLHHDVTHYEDGETLDVLYSVLNYIPNKVEKDFFKLLLYEIVADLNNINIIAGGSERKTYDILRHAFSLMFDQDINAQNQTKTVFDDSSVNIFLRASEKTNLTWDIAYDEIKEIKEIIDDQSSDQDQLEKALRCIPDNPVFDTVYTHPNLNL
ncbi:unnamed protein product [Rotaria sp. Silwood1]|nr:unnamed protein product [Rotaria sp. Silwood1]